MERDPVVVICLDSIIEASEKKAVTDKISKSGKELINITLEQMNHFAGNMLQVNDRDGKNTW